MENLVSVAENTYNNLKGNFTQQNISYILTHVPEDNIIYPVPIEKETHVWVMSILSKLTSYTT